MTPSGRVENIRGTRRGRQGWSQSRGTSASAAKGPVGRWTRGRRGPGGQGGRAQGTRARTRTSEAHFERGQRHEGTRVWPEVKDGQVGVSPARQAPLVRHPGRDRLRAVPTSLEEQEEAGRAVGGGAEGRPAKPALSTSARVKIRFREGECIPAFDRFHKKKKCVCGTKLTQRGGWRAGR